jgi:hypothetical protein
MTAAAASSSAAARRSPRACRARLAGGTAGEAVVALAGDTLVRAAGDDVATRTLGVWRAEGAGMDAIWNTRYD